MKKYFNVSFFARLILGSIFIYSSIYKLMNPQIFEKALDNYDVFPHALTRFITISFPWVELFLGVLLISGILARYAALAIILLLLIFILLTVIGVSKGNSTSCGCFPESSILNSNNPFVLIIRNYLLLTLAVVIIVAKIGLKSQPLISIKGHVSGLSLIIILAFSVSILFALIAKRSYEKNFLSFVLSERNQVINELENPDNKYLIGSEIKYISDIVFPKKTKSKIIVMLTLHSFDCKTCVDEAIYMEYLNNKYREHVYFCAVVGNIGNTAINNFKSLFSLTYPFVQDSNILKSKIFSRYKSLKTIVSEKNEILRIDPVTYNVKTLRSEYENILLKYLK